MVSPRRFHSHLVQQLDSRLLHLQKISLQSPELVLILSLAVWELDITRFGNQTYDCYTCKSIMSRADDYMKACGACYSGNNY